MIAYAKGADVIFVSECIQHIYSYFLAHNWGHIIYFKNSILTNTYIVYLY